MGIDNHNIQASVAAELVKLLQVAAVVDEPASLFAVILHEVFFKHIETLGNSLTDGDARHHDDELGKAVGFIQLQQGTQVNIGLAGAGRARDQAVHDEINAGGDDGRNAGGSGGDSRESKIEEFVTTKS